jgi:hypothetical protein
LGDELDWELFGVVGIGKNFLETVGYFWSFRFFVGSFLIVRKGLDQGGVSFEIWNIFEKVLWHFFPGFRSSPWQSVSRTSGRVASPIRPCPFLLLLCQSR